VTLPRPITFACGGHDYWLTYYWVSDICQSRADFLAAIEAGSATRHAQLGQDGFYLETLTEQDGRLVLPDLPEYARLELRAHWVELQAAIDAAIATGRMR
jgi:hypothetical protein